MTWPFENNTNAITRKLAKRSLQADKRRNIFLIVTITLTTALLSGIFFTVFAEQRKMLSDLRGQYQTVVMETTQKEIEHLSTQPEIEQWGLSKDFGSARYQDSTLVVGYADKGWMKLGEKTFLCWKFPGERTRDYRRTGLFRLFWIATGNRTDNSFEFRQRRSGLYHFWYFAKGK